MTWAHGHAAWTHRTPSHMIVAVPCTHSADFFARFAPVADDDRLPAAALWVYWGFAFDDARCDSGPLSGRPAQFKALAVRGRPADRQPGSGPYAFTGRVLGDAASVIGRPSDVRPPGTGHRSGGARRGAAPTGGAGADRDGDHGGRPRQRPALSAQGTEPGPGRPERLHGADGRAFPLHAGSRRRGHKLRDRILRRFVELHDRVRPRAGADLATYLQGLRHGARGNNE